jgi:hypothetical protein
MKLYLSSYHLSDHVGTCSSLKAACPPYVALCGGSHMHQMIPRDIHHRVIELGPGELCVNFRDKWHGFWIFNGP